MLVSEHLLSNTSEPSLYIIIIVARRSLRRSAKISLTSLTVRPPARDPLLNIIIRRIVVAADSSTLQNLPRIPNPNPNPNPIRRRRLSEPGQRAKCTPVPPVTAVGIGQPEQHNPNPNPIRRRRLPEPGQHAPVPPATAQPVTVCIGQPEQRVDYIGGAQVYLYRDSSCRLTVREVLLIRALRRPLPAQVYPIP
jgi:hypothetical protein